MGEFLRSTEPRDLILLAAPTSPSLDDSRGKPRTTAEPDRAEKRGHFAFVVAELDENGHEYVAVLRAMHPTYEQALRVLEREHRTLFRERDRTHRVREIADDRFELVNLQGQPYRRYLVKEV